MVQQSYVRDGKDYSLTIKINAKGDVSGEYTVKADSIEELRAKDSEAKDALMFHLSN